jgi:hypothetical protein
MSSFITSLAKVAATKIVAALVAFGVSFGVVIPLDESASLTAGLTLVIAAALQVLWQLVTAWAEKKWPNLANLQPAVLRVMMRNYSVRAVR